MSPRKNGTSNFMAALIGGIEQDIEAVASGQEIEPGTGDDGLLSAQNPAFRQTGRVILYDPKLPMPVVPTEPGVVHAFIPDNGRDPHLAVIEKPGRNGNVPPVAHRFKPGQSGNPRGRPRNSVSKLLRDLLNAGDQKYTKRILRALLEKASTGDVPAIRAVLAFVEPAQLATLLPKSGKTATNTRKPDP